MDYELSEQDVVDRLIEKLGNGFDIKPLPEVESEFINPTDKVIVSVAYKESSFGDQGEKKGSFTSMGVITQDEVVIFELFFQGIKLRGEGGIYDAFKKSKLALIGFQPSDCYKMYLIKSGWVGRQEKTAVWTFTCYYACSTKVVEDFTEEDSPLIKRITVDSEFNDSEIE